MVFFSYKYFMPVTIIFYGLTRSLKKTIKSLKKNIFKPLNDENIPFQIYIHTYDLNELTNERSGENKAKLDHNSDLNLLKSVTKEIESAYLQTFCWQVCLSLTLKLSLLIPIGSSRSIIIWKLRFIMI